MTKKPSFKAEESQDNNRRAWVYHLSGKFVGTPACYSFLEDARENISTDFPHVVLVMSDLKIINSTGVGMIASLMTACKDGQGKLFVVDAPDSARRQLEVTRVWEFLTPVDNLDGLPANLDD